MYYGNGKELRKGRHSEIGYVYHIVFSTINRSPILNDFHNARIIIKQLMDSDNNSRTETLSFCVMPDHVHWLFKLNKGTLSKNIQRVKANYTRQFSQKIWNKGFYDHAIRSDESLINVARYIVANPLRAGLVESVKDYSYWDSVWLE